ncbi:MAG: hypothetical protein ACK4G1_02640, partial [Ignavibacteria bacterium]
MVRLFRALFAFLFIITISNAQRNSDIQLKKIELNKIRQEIQELDKKLKETMSKEKQNLNLIDTYDNQVGLIKSLI